MKKLLILGSFVALLFNTAPAQTSLTDSNSVLGSLAQPASILKEYLAANTNAPAATNWTVAPYASYAKSLKSKYGFGLAAVYYMTPYVGTQIRAQYLDTGIGTGTSKVWLPNGTITLQSAYKPFGNSIPLTLRPVLEAGVGVNLDGRMFAIAGAGTEVDVFTAKSATARFQRLSIFYGVEQWQGGTQKFSVQQIGVAVNFNLGGKGFMGLF